SAQAEPLRDRPAALNVRLGEVGEQPTALTHEDQQPTAAVVVVLVVLQVLGELVDATRQHRDLHLGRTGVAFLGAELPDDLGLRGLVERHNLPLRWVSIDPAPAASCRHAGPAGYPAFS